MVYVEQVILGDSSEESDRLGHGLSSSLLRFCSSFPRYQMNKADSPRIDSRTYTNALRIRGCSQQLAQDAGEILARHRDQADYSPLERAILQRTYARILPK